MENILVSVDLSQNTNELIEAAVEQGKAFGAKIWILHAAAPDPDFVGYDVGPQYIRDFRAKELRKEHRELQEMAEAIKAKGLEAEGLLIQGATIDTIISEAQKLQIDLIVCGHEEHGFFTKLLFGSISEGIIHRSSIPVLLVPVA
jgi:nucleotide-binding universal stress UspA family protein